MQVGRLRARRLHHVGQNALVFQDGAGAQQVVVERLAFVVGHEEGRAQRVEQRDLADVRVGVMGEHARLHVSRRVDVQVAPPAGDAAAHELAVVLKVEREQRLLLAHGADEAVQALALVGVHHQLRRGVRADGQVGEYPAE